MEHLSERRAAVVPPHSIRSWPLPRVSSPLVDAMRADIESAGDQAVERLRSYLAAEGTPIVEPEDENACRITFVWIGDAPHGVVLQLNRFFDPLDVEDTTMDAIGGSQVHAITLRLPNDWLGSYLFVVLPQRVPPTLHAPVDRQMIGALAPYAQTDPFAREHLPNKAATATAGRAMPEYSAARAPAAPAAALWTHEPPTTTELAPVASPLTEQLLLFHRFSLAGAGDASPVILVLDGEVWRTQLPLAAELAQRADRGEFPPAHLLFLDSGGPMQRQLDYTATPAETRELLARARESASRAVPDAPWIVAGQSLGGLFAALAATRHPQWVSAAVAQSPSLWWPSVHGVWAKGPGWFEERAASSGAPILLEAGAIDAGIVEYTRPAAALLSSQGALIDYREHAGGHDILWWQAALPDALARALG